MSAFRYPAAPHARRHGPQGYADAESYRPWLRDEFAFRCVYCLFREQWGRIKAAFTLDHFVPVSIAPGKDRTYDNLLYACAACNAAKGSTLLPDPTQVLTADSVSVDEDGKIVGLTEESRRLIRLIGLDSREETEVRLLWIGLIALAERHAPALYRRLLGFPEDLLNLGRLRPPSGNSRPAGALESYCARRRGGTLPATYRDPLRRMARPLCLFQRALRPMDSARRHFLAADHGRDQRRHLSQSVASRLATPAATSGCRGSCGRVADFKITRQVPAIASIDRRRQFSTRRLRELADEVRGSKSADLPNSTTL